jgi:hypothetical protein
MIIRVETSKRTGIDNIQEFELSAFERNWSAEIPKKYPRAVQRTQPSPLYNCHGLTFASRRTRIIESYSLSQIIGDDKWAEIDIREVLAGDIVIYFSADGDANHSGVVVGIADLGVPKVFSKWGSAGEYIHLLNDCPPLYGPQTRFYRCHL